MRVFESFHDDMEAEVRQRDGSTTERFKVTSGLRQGCCISPSVFNGYFHFVIEDYCRRAEQLGIFVTFKWNDQKRLIGRLPCDARAILEKLASLQFADDAAIMAPDRHHLELGLRLFQQVASEWGLLLSLPKTVAVRFGAQHEQPEQPLELVGGTVAYKADFRYLGTLIHCSGAAAPEAQFRVNKGAAAFGALRAAVFENRHISLKAKATVFKSVVLGVALYGAETWAATESDLRSMDVWQNHCVRVMTGVHRFAQLKEHIHDTELRARLNLSTMTEVIEERRLKWLGHVFRMPPERLPRKVLFSWLPGTRPRGRPHMRWSDAVMTALRRRNCQGEEWRQIAEDRTRWRAFCDGQTAPEARYHRYPRLAHAN